MRKRAACFVLMLVGVWGLAGCATHEASEEGFRLHPRRGFATWEDFIGNDHKSGVDNQSLRLGTEEKYTILARYALREFTLDASEDVLRVYRESLVQRRVNPIFLSELDDAISWRRTFESKTLAEVATHAEEFLAAGMQTDDLYAQQYYGHISGRLLESLSLQGLPGRLRTLKARRPQAEPTVQARYT